MHKSILLIAIVFTIAGSCKKTEESDSSGKSAQTSSATEWTQKSFGKKLFDMDATRIIPAVSDDKYYASLNKTDKSLIDNPFLRKAEYGKMHTGNYNQTRNEQEQLALTKPEYLILQALGKDPRYPAVLMAVYNGFPQSIPLSKPGVKEFLRNGSFKFLRVSRGVIAVVSKSAVATPAVSSTTAVSSTAAAGGAVTAATVAAGAVVVAGSVVIGYMLADLIHSNYQINKATKDWTKKEKKDIYRGNSYWDNFCRIYGFGC